MRYTTIIDISESKELYRNVNIRIVYLHLVLKSGYHDDDRDMCYTSLRTLAAQTGLSVATVRHAVKQLTNAKLVERTEHAYKVLKWVQVDKPTVRPAARKGKADAAQAQRINEEQALNREREAEQRKQLRQRGKTEFMIYFENLQKRAAEGDLDAQVQIQKRQAMYDAQVAKLKEQNK